MPAALLAGAGSPRFATPSEIEPVIRQYGTDVGDEGEDDQIVPYPDAAPDFTGLISACG